ncbi:TPA: hypothetical protein ACYHN4_002825 [Vibrio cholerae]
MSDNDYYKRTKEFDPRTRANGLDVEFELDAISAAFDKIPAPREDGQGYDGPIHVGEATAPTHAVQLQQMEAKLGDNTENANRAEEAAERAEEARDIAIEKARQSGEARDEALEAAATVTNIHREQLEKALGVNARVYPRLTNQNLKVGDIIPAPEDTADGLPITHVIVDGNAYAMSPVSSGLVADLKTASATIGGVIVKLINQTSITVPTFNDALNNATRCAEIFTTGHTNAGIGGATYFRIDETGTPSSGNEGKFFDANGLGWKLKHQGTVTYAQFGVGLGATDDMPKIRQCHAFANAEKAKVHSGGELTIIADSNTNVEVLTETDFGGSKFIVNDGCNGAELFSILPSADRQPFTVPTLVKNALQPQLKEGAFFFSALQLDAALDNCLIVVENSHRLSRRGAGSADVLREDSFIHFRDGNCLGALLCDHTSGSLTITARPLERKVLEFGNVNIVQNFTDNTKRFTFVRTQRNQTQYKKIFVENDGVLDNLADSSSVIQAKYVALLLIEDVDGENMNAGIAGNSGYAISMQHCVAPTFNRVSPNSGWGVTNTNWVKSWVVNDSYLNRIDNHYGLGDLSVKDCRLIIQNIEIGYGRGTITLDNVVVAQGINPLITPDDEPITLGVVNLRAGWQLGYRGEINLNNVKIEITGEYPSIAERAWVGGVSYGRQNIAGCEPTVDFYIPNVNIKGLHLNVVGSLSAPLEFFGVLMWDEYFVASDTNEVYAPSRISVSGMTSNNESDNLTFKPFKGISTQMSSSRWKQKTCEVQIEDCRNSTDSFNKSITNLTNYDNWRFTRSLFDWGFPSVDQDLSRVTFNVSIYRSSGSVYLNMISGNVKAHHSEIVELRGYGSGITQKLSKISHSKIWPLFRQSGADWNWYFANQNQSLLAESCEVVNANYAPSPVKTVSLRNRQRLIDCYTSYDATIDQTGVDRLNRSFEVSNDMLKKTTL